MFDGILELAFMHLRYAQNTVSVIIYETILWLLYGLWDGYFRISFLAVVHDLVTSVGMVRVLGFDKISTLMVRIWDGISFREFYKYKKKVLKANVNTICIMSWLR